MTRRRIIELVGILGMASCTLLFAAVWWVAFLTGHPVLVTIDTFGETSLEIVLWFLLGPVMLFSIYAYLARFPLGASDRADE